MGIGDAEAECGYVLLHGAARSQLPPHAPAFSVLSSEPVLLVVAVGWQPVPLVIESAA